MRLRSEILALAFGALLMLITFGDGHVFWFVGNLDTIFGLTFWRALDIFYPVASIAVFLLYGWVKGNGLKLNALTVLLFVSFVIFLLLVNVDDVVQVLNVTLLPSKVYWIAIMWIFPFYSCFTFFLFGKKHETLRTLQKTASSIHALL